MPVQTSHHRQTQARKPSGKLAAAAFVACAALILASCGGMDSQQASQTPVQPPPSSPPAPQMQAQVVLCNSVMANCTAETSFSLESVRAVNVMVTWQNLPAGTHTQRMSFSIPGGDPYKAYDQSFAVADGSGGAATTIQALPVTGTWIARRRMTGMWNLSLELDGQSVATQSFEIMP